MFNVHKSCFVLISRTTSTLSSLWAMIWHISTVRSWGRLQKALFICYVRYKYTVNDWWWSWRSESRPYIFCGKFSIYGKQTFLAHTCTARIKRPPPQCRMHVKSRIQNAARVLSNHTQRPTLSNSHEVPEDPFIKNCFFDGGRGKVKRLKSTTDQCKIQIHSQD